MLVETSDDDDEDWRSAMRNLMSEYGEGILYLIIGASFVGLMAYVLDYLTSL